METVCQTCGDLGWSVALIYCEECQNLAVHRYCLKRFPKTFDEYVVWHCDDCKSELPLFDGVRETISIVPDGQNDLDLRLVDLLRTKNKRLKKSHINKKKAKIQQVVLGDDNEPQEQEIPISGAKRKSAEIEISDGGSEPSCCTISLKDEVEEEPVSTLEKEADDSVVKKSKLSPLPELDSSRSASYISYVPAQPIIDPIWRGRFSITPKQGYSCQVLAHLSSLACFRVSQEAKLFPEILSSELHPRLAVWPKGFDDHGPNDDSIALYLFPESESDERVFKNLLNEMIRNDHALRAVVTHAELLVFPSTKLPLRHWRFQKKLYLWGVFRAKQASPEVFNPDRHNADKSHTNTTENRPLEVS